MPGKATPAQAFDVIGFDVAPQPHYPFEYIQADLFDLDPEELAREFNAIHISPPCQRFLRGIVRG